VEYPYHSTSTATVFWYSLNNYFLEFKESTCTKGGMPFLSGLVVDEERMRSVGDFLWLEAVLKAFQSFDDLLRTQTACALKHHTSDHVELFEVMWSITATTTTVLRPLYRSTCISHYLQLRTGRFCWRKILLSACPCWWQPAQSDYGEDAGVLNSAIYTCTVVMSSISGDIT